MTEGMAIVVIGIGISVNTLLNVIYLFLINGVTKRLERIENLFIKSNLKQS